MSLLRIILLALIGNKVSEAWVSRGVTYNIQTKQSSHLTSLQSTSTEASAANLHGQNSCFLPLRQFEQDSYAPRIVQIAGAYPGLTKEDFMAVQSEERPEPGQWTYDFSDPDGPQLGTVAVEGSQTTYACVDAVAIIAEHTSVGISLPPEIQEPVDLVVLVDRSMTFFEERKFLVISEPGKEALTIGAFGSKKEIPQGSEILGQVLWVSIPWLPCMAPTKSGFAEADECF